MTARKPLDIDRLIIEIEAGDHDGRLADLVIACRERADVGPTSLRWRITFDGKTWDQDSLTVGEQRFVDQYTGAAWTDSPLQSAAVFAAFVVAHLHKVEGMEVAEAIEKADAISRTDAIAAVTQYQVDEPAPKDPGT